MDTLRSRQTSEALRSRQTSGHPEEQADQWSPEEQADQWSPEEHADPQWSPENQADQWTPWGAGRAVEPCWAGRPVKSRGAGRPVEALRTRQSSGTPEAQEDPQWCVPSIRLQALIQITLRCLTTDGRANGSSNTCPLSSLSGGVWVYSAPIYSLHCHFKCFKFLQQKPTVSNIVQFLFQPLTFDLTYFWNDKINSN